MKRAQKAVSEARAQAKNERRKKARLLKKAAGLSPADLERIAVLKRCGLWDPNLGAPPADEDGTGGVMEKDATAPIPPDAVAASASACEDAPPSGAAASITVAASSTPAVPKEAGAELLQDAERSDADDVAASPRSDTT
jgi:hypothetical protein